MAEREGAAGWDARAYDESFGFVSDHGEPLVRLLDPRPGERVLDLGCGTGRLAADIAARGAETVGVDRDAAMIAAARERFPPSAHPSLAFVRGDGEALGRAAGLAGPFDAVFSNAALHWMTRPDAVLRGVRALLRPGGRLVAELGGRGNVAAIERALRAALGAAVVLPRRGRVRLAARTERLRAASADAVRPPHPARGRRGRAGGVAADVRRTVAGGPVRRRRRDGDRARRGSAASGAVARRRLVADYRRLRVTAVRDADREEAADGGG